MSRLHVASGEDGELKRPRNLCRACGEDFASVEMFDRHRVGVHEYTFAEGLAMSPSREDGRRCLDEEEIEAEGWRTDKRGRWFDPIRRVATHRAFRTDGTPESVSEGSARPGGRLEGQLRIPEDDREAV